MSSPVVVERVFDASPELVWKAITEPERMRQWYFNIPAFRAEPGFEFEFLAGPENGEKYRHVCKVTAVEPGRRLSCTWRYAGFEGSSEVTFELFPQGRGTRLKLTHEGIETFPHDRPDFAPASFEKGWTYIIGTSLQQYLA